MDLHEIAAELALGGVASDELRDRAYEILLAGHESQTMAALAGAEKDTHPADLRAMFYMGLAELGVSVPAPLEAAETLKRVWARAVADGRLGPHEGASRIVGLLYDVAELRGRGDHYEEFGIATLAGLCWALDDTHAHDPATRREIETQIVAECARIACVDVASK